MKIGYHILILFIFSIFFINKSYSTNINNNNNSITNNNNHKNNNNNNNNNNNISNSSNSSLELVNSENSQERIYDINPTITSLSSNELSQKIINLYSKFPRFDLTFNKVNNTFNPKNESYIQSVILTGFPFDLLIILTIVTIISIVIAIVIIRVRRYCKKVRRSQYKYRLIKYHKKSQRSTFKYIFSTTTTIILLVTVCSCLFVSLFVNQDLDNAVILSIDNLESHLSNRVQVEERVIKECRPITHVPYDAYEIVSTTKDILNLTNSTKQLIHKYENYRYEFIFISSMVLFAILSLGLLSIIIRFKFSLALFIGLGLLVLCCVWIVPGTHVPMGVMLADICPQMDTIIESYAPDNISPYVSFFLNCTDSDNFNFIYGLLDQKINSIEMSIQRAKRYHYSNNTIIRLENRLQGLFNLSRDAKDMLNCNITSNTFKSTQNLICIDIINSSFILSVLFVLIGFLLSISFITSLIVYSNSSRLKRSNNIDNFTKYDNNYKNINSYYSNSNNNNNNNINNNYQYDEDSTTPLITSSIISDQYDYDSDYDNDDDISDFENQNNQNNNNSIYILN